MAGLRSTGDRRTRALRRRWVSTGGMRRTMTEGTGSGLKSATNEPEQARGHKAERSVTCERLLSRARVMHGSDMPQQQRPTQVGGYGVLTAKLKTKKDRRQ